MKEQTETDPMNISFSSEQLVKLRVLEGAHDDEMTTHDVLCAYIILTMNKNIPFITATDHIRRAYILVNYRGVSDLLAPKGHVGNPIMFLLSSDFPNSLSLCSVLLKTIRQAIKTTRDELYLGKWIATADALRRQGIKDGRVSFVWDTDEVVFNSN